MNRSDIINALIKKIDAKQYLEIGIFQGWNFNLIQCENKDGVDPDIRSKCNYHMTSDEFFEQNQKIYDVIFIDGLHHADTVQRDINNSLKYLSPNGYIVCHDMNPWNEETQNVPQSVPSWTGDCWKAWVRIRSKNKNLNMVTVDTDCGCGIISFGNQDLLEINCELTYYNLEQNRKHWLNLITIDEFRTLYGI
jgi:hypothetical protein